MDYERNGWVHRLSGEELEAHVKPVCYLPHHGTYRPDKQSTPLRIVFDPACQYQGISLNSFLFKGPCLIGNLLGVLLRFREEPITLVRDISKMYLQIEFLFYLFYYFFNFYTYLLLTNWVTGRRQARSSVSLEKPGAHKEAHYLRPSKSDLWWQTLARHGKFCNAENGQG